MRVLVTGAAGFIGSHLADRLVADGHEVIGIDDMSSGHNTPEHTELLRMDVADPALVTLAAERRPEVICHLAAQVSVRVSVGDPARDARVNVLGTVNMLEAARAAGARKVVFTSSLYAYGSRGPEPMSETDVPAPTTVYGMSKVAGEHMLRAAAREHGLRSTIARLFFIYGPRQFVDNGYKSVIPRNFERIARGESPVVYGDGSQALDYVYVDDCVEALLAMLPPEHDGWTYNVCTGRAISVNTLTQLMLDVAGSNLEPASAPPDWTAGTIRAGLPTLAERRLGWRAKTPIEEGLARVWQWLGEQPTPELAGASSR